MRRRVRLTESDLCKIVKESINNVLNEVMYNGVSYHGTNPYDWVDLAQVRGERSDAHLMNSIRAEKEGNTSLANSEDEKSDIEMRKKIRNKRNAKQLGWQGKGDTRLGKAQEYFNMSQNAQNPQDKQKYNKMASDTLGDVEGRAEQNLRKLRQSQRGM